MKPSTFCFLFVSILIAVAGQEERAPSPYCGFSAQHTMCRFQGVADKCGAPSLRGLDDKAKRSVIQAHNLLRSQVASGNEARGAPGPQPSAANMQVMIWDDELAAVAQRHADQCRFEHDCSNCRRVVRFPVGQNLAVEWTSGRALAPNWKQVAQNWYDEVALFPNTSVSNYKFDAATGHYSQVVWASTNRVGCGFTQYKDGLSQTNLYVCNYGPAGNFISLPTYRPGSPCSQCPSGTACSAVYAGLCEPVKKPTVAIEENVIEQPTSKPVVRPPPTASPIIVKPTVTATTATTTTVTPAISSNSTLDGEFVCIIGRGLCRVGYRSVPWSFKTDPTSVTVPKYLGADLRPGEVTELQVNKQFLAANPGGVVCLALKLRQKLLAEDRTFWLLPPVVLKVLPENGLPVAVPVSTGVGSRWVQVKVNLSRLSSAFRVVFQQTGPTHVLGVNVSSVSLELGLEEMRISPASCNL